MVATTQGVPADLGPKRRATKPEVEAAIRAEGGNLSRAAIRLGISRQTLYTYIYRFDLARLAGVDLNERRPSATPAGPEPVQVSMKLPGDIWQWVRIFAIQTDRNASAVVAEALELYRQLATGEKGGRDAK